MEEETTTTTTTTTTEETQPLLPPGSADSAGCDKKDVQPLLKQYVVNLILAKIKADRMMGKNEEQIKKEVVNTIYKVICGYDKTTRATIALQPNSSNAIMKGADDEFYMADEYTMVRRKAPPLMFGTTSCEDANKASVYGLYSSIWANVVGKIKTDQTRGIPPDITKKQVKATLLNIVCEYDTIAGTKVLSKAFINQNIQTGFDTIRNRNAFKADLPAPTAAPAAKKTGFFSSWFGSSKGGRKSKRRRSGKRGGRKTTKRRGAKGGTRRRR